MINRQWIKTIVCLPPGRNLHFYSYQSSVRHQVLITRLPHFLNNNILIDIYFWKTDNGSTQSSLHGSVLNYINSSLQVDSNSPPTLFLTVPFTLTIFVGDARERFTINAMWCRHLCSAMARFAPSLKKLHLPVMNDFMLIEISDQQNLEVIEADLATVVTGEETLKKLKQNKIRSKLKVTQKFSRNRNQTYKSIDILQEIAFGPRAQLSNEDIVSVLTSIKSIRICNLHDEVRATAPHAIQHLYYNLIPSHQMVYPCLKRADLRGSSLCHL